MNKDTLMIQNVILHIIDSENLSIMSHYTLDLSLEIQEFVTNHLAKVLGSDDCKACHFNQLDGFVASQLNTYLETGDFLFLTHALSERLQTLVFQNPDIPSADVLFVTFVMDELHYLALLKMNYKPSFIHFVQMENQLAKNTIIKQKTTLPQSTQKLDEAVIICLEDLNILLIEKQYQVDGKKSMYLSEHFLDCSLKSRSPKAQLRVLTQIADTLNKEYFHDDPIQKMAFKKVVNDVLEETGEINTLEIARNYVPDNIEIQQIFTEKLIEKGIAKEPIRFDNETSTRKMTKQTLKTDTGYEINIPLDQFGQNDNFEIINQPDGTLSIVIKNIKSIL